MEIAKAFGERVDGWTSGKCLCVIVFKCLGSFNSNTQTPTRAQRLTAGKHAKTHRCIFVLLGLLLALVVTVTAAAATVEGSVVDENDQPLAGANVQLFDERSGAQRYGTATRADGTFRVENVRSGRYQVVVTYVGFAAFEQRVVVRAGETVVVRAQMSRRAVSQQEVLVTAHRAREQLNPITFSNLTRRDLEAQPAMKDLPVHLATLPSVTFYTENGNGIGYSYLRMRGFGQRRVAVAINGVPQNDPEEHNVFWINFFDVQGAIEDIQVQRGAGSSFYGSTGIGGAINVVARPYKPYPYATAEVGYGAFDTQRYTLEANTGLLADRYVAFGRFSRLLSDGYRDWSWTEFWRFFAGITRYGDRHTLTLQAYGGPQKDGLAFVGIPKAANEETVTDDFGTVIDRRYNFSSFTRDLENFHQPHLELLHDWQLDPDWTFHQTVFGIQGIGYFDFGGTFRSADYLRLPAGWRGLSDEDRTLPLFITAPDVSALFRASLDQWQIGWMPRLTHTHATGETTFGAEVRLHRSLRWGRIQEAEGIPPALVGSDNDAQVYNFRGEKIITSLYGSHLFRPVERLAVQADVQLTWRRYRIFDEDIFGNAFDVPYVFVNPRLGVTFNPEQPLSAYLSVALANREPRMKTLYDGEEAGAGFQPQFERAPDGSFDYDAPFVEPEQLLDVELGGALVRTRYRVAANVFLMDFHDEIVPSGGLDQFGVPRTGNAERTRHLGLEIEAAARLAPGLDLRANATLSRNRFVRFKEFVTLPDFSIVEVERNDNPIAGFPEQVGNLGLSYQRGGLTALLNVKYAGKQYIDNSGGNNPDGTPNDDLEVDPYTLVNASLQYEFPQNSALRGLRLGLDVNNVLDDEVLLFGNVGFGTPQFFPTATRHAFFSARYTLR